MKKKFALNETFEMLYSFQLDLGILNVSDMIDS